MPASWVSPDGKSYAYVTQTSGVPGQGPTSAVFLHDVAGGKDHQLWSGEGGSQLAGFGPGGVYFTRLAAGVVAGPFGAAPDLWVVDLAGRARRIGPNPPSPAPSGPLPPVVAGPLPPALTGAPQLAGGALWRTAGGSVPQVQPGGSGTLLPPNQIQRIDLQDGSTSTWFTGPESSVVGVTGFDDRGHPVVAVIPVLPIGVGPSTPPDPSAGHSIPSPPRLLLLTAPDQTVELSDGSSTATSLGAAFGDSHGLWLSSPGSLWLYRAGALRKVADVPASLFAAPTPPPGAPATFAGSVPGYPMEPVLRVVGPCQ